MIPKLYDWAKCHKIRWLIRKYFRTISKEEPSLKVSFSCQVSAEKWIQISKYSFYLVDIQIWIIFYSMTWQEKTTFELCFSLVIFKTFFTAYRQVCKTEIWDSPMSISLKPSLFTQLHIQCAEASYNYLYLRTLKLDRNTKFTYLSTYTSFSLVFRV